ncbi:division/cell wall cluster transcriptional repressor MraZ [soil metagenome]
MFLGRYDHTIDTKGRVALPARYRDHLSDGVVVTRGFDACLLVYPMSQWAPLAERVSGLSISDPDVRALRRLLFADAADLDLDKQGRILIPSGLRDYAGLDRDAVVVGMHTFIEIWNPERWSIERSTLDRDGLAVAERLAELI